MSRIGEDPQYDVRSTEKAKASAWSIYRRLLGYAFRYKARLAVSLLFAVIVAGSFTVMLAGVAGVVDIVFSEADLPNGVTAEELTDDERADLARKQEDLARTQLVARYSGPIKKQLKRVDFLFSWSDEEVDARVGSLVEDMRDDGMQAIKVAGGIVIVLMFFAGLARFLQEYIAGTIGANISVTLAREMFENVMGLSLDFFEKHPTGEILARFTNDVFQVNRGLAGVFVKLLREPIKSVFFLTVAMSVDPFLTLLGLCVLPPVAIIMHRMGKKYKKSVRKSLQKIASMASVANETFSGITIVKGFCMESYEVGRTRGELDKLRRYLKRMVKVDAAIGPLVEMVIIVGIVAFILFAGRRVDANQMSGADVVTLFGALAMMLDPVRKLTSVNNLIQTSVASAERVFEFIDVKSSVVERDVPLHLSKLQKSLRFENVQFAYKEGTNVLSDIDLDIKKGEMVAFVGFSGAGKSTMVKLLPRFYDVTGGRVTIDGIDIRDASFTSLRGQISIVTQDTILFNESVRDNIAFGQSEYSEDRVALAARAAYAHKFIEDLPKGYDSVIGERGTTLSGGQRQRLAIARAIIKDPAILILDEATSSLDTESEQAIQKAIEEFVVGRTTIVIAHRLSTIQRADRIVVFDEGRIAEIGTHEELLAEGGIYQRLHEQQFRSNGNGEPAA